MSPAVTAQFVIRFRGLDDDVSIRCEDDDGAAMSRQLAYRPKIEAVELYALDGWTKAEPSSSLTLAQFEAHANTALSEMPNKIVPLSNTWELDPAVKRPGHSSQSGGWVDSAPVLGSSTLFTCCSFRLQLISGGVGDYDLAYVGGLTVKIDYWLSLSLV